MRMPRLPSRKVRWPKSICCAQHGESTPYINWSGGRPDLLVWLDSCPSLFFAHTKPDEGAATPPCSELWSKIPLLTIGEQGSIKYEFNLTAIPNIYLNYLFSSREPRRLSESNYSFTWVSRIGFVSIIQDIVVNPKGAFQRTFIQTIYWVGSCFCNFMQNVQSISLTISHFAWKCSRKNLHSVWYVECLYLSLKR